MAKKDRDYAASLTDDVDMQRTLRGESDNASGSTPMDQMERDYFQGVGQRPSAVDAIRKARKANKKPPLKYGS